MRSLHAVVSHRSFLPHCSIAENIAYGDNSREITRREIEDAAYSAYAHEFITDLTKVRNWNFVKSQRPCYNLRQLPEVFSNMIPGILMLLNICFRVMTQSPMKIKSS